MSSRPLRSVASARSAIQRAQMSRHSPLAKTFAPHGGRGRAQPLRVVRRVAGDVTRVEFLAWWSGLMLRRCGSAHAVTKAFDCTEQTGRNWIDGVACPTGLAVMRAFDLWPEDFAGAAAFMARGTLRRAA